MATKSPLTPAEGGFDEQDAWSWYKRICSEANHAWQNGSPALLLQLKESIDRAAANNLDVFTIQEFQEQGVPGRTILHQLFHSVFENQNKEKFRVDKKHTYPITEIAKYYIDNGCPPHARSDLPYTPSQYAVEANLYDLAWHMQQKAPAPASMVNHANQTLLHMLIAGCNFKTIADSHNESARKLLGSLIENQDMMRHRDSNNKTPMMLWADKLSAFVSDWKFNKATSSKPFLENQFSAMVGKGALTSLSPAEKLELVVQLIKCTAEGLPIYDCIKTLTKNHKILTDFSTDQLLTCLSTLNTNNGNRDHLNEHHGLITALITELGKREEHTIDREKIDKIFNDALYRKDTFLAKCVVDFLDLSKGKHIENALVRDNKEVALTIAEKGGACTPEQQQAIRQNLFKLHDAHEMVTELARRIAIPAILLEAGFDPSDLEDSTNFEMKFNAVLHLETGKLSAITSRIEDALLGSFAVVDTPQKAVGAIERIDNLSRTWHHPAIVFPNELVNFRTGDKMLDRAWHPILHHPKTKHTFIANNGYTLQCLTTGAQLKQEHDALHHCIDTYTNNCCSPNTKERSHIFSVKDPQGNHVATMELKQGNHDCILSSADQTFSVTQLEGKKINGRRDLIRQGPALDAAKDLIAAIDGTWIQTGQQKAAPKLELNTRTLGETQESIAMLDMHPAIVTAGYVPTWEHLEKVFSEFKSPARRGAVSVSKTNTLVYTDAPGGKLAHLGSQHFINGTYTVDGSEISARDMDAKTWLKATGLQEMIRDVIRKASPELAAKREAAWSGTLSAESESAPITEPASTPTTEPASTPTTERPDPNSVGSGSHSGGLRSWFSGLGGTRRGGS